MATEDHQTPWLCHICDYSSNIGEGLVCSECYKITCNQHMTITPQRNPDSGLFELKRICVECQFRKEL